MKGESIVFFSNDTGTVDKYPNMQICKNPSKTKYVHLMPYAKIDSRYIVDINIKAKTTKLPEHL